MHRGTSTSANSCRSDSSGSADARNGGRRPAWILFAAGLAVRPSKRVHRSCAQEVALETDSEVDLSTQDGTIVISPVMQKTVSLRHLLSKVTEENIHGEISTGKVEGREAW